MPRLTPVSWRELIDGLRQLGFDGPYAGGRHPQMRRGETTVIVPNPHKVLIARLHVLKRNAGMECQVLALMRHFGRTHHDFWAG